MGGRTAERLHRARDLPRRAPHQQRAQQRQHQAGRNQQRERAIELGHDQAVGLRHQQRPAGVADGLDHGEARLAAVRVAVGEVHRLAGAHRRGGRLQVVAAGMREVVLQRAHHGHARGGAQGHGAARRHQHHPPAFQVGQAVHGRDQVVQADVQAGHAAAGRLQRHVVAGHPHAAGGVVEVGLGPPAARGGLGAPVPGLAAVVVAVEDEIAQAAVGTHVAGVGRGAGLPRFHRQQRAGGAGHRLHHRRLRFLQLRRGQRRARDQPRQVVAGDGDGAQAISRRSAASSVVARVSSRARSRIWARR